MRQIQKAPVLVQAELLWKNVLQFSSGFIPTGCWFLGDGCLEVKHVASQNAHTWCFATHWGLQPQVEKQDFSEKPPEELLRVKDPSLGIWFYFFFWNSYLLAKRCVMLCHFWWRLSVYYVVGPITGYIILNLTQSVSTSVLWRQVEVWKQQLTVSNRGCGIL